MLLKPEQLSPLTLLASLAKKYNHNDNTPYTLATLSELAELASALSLQLAETLCNKQLREPH